MNKKNIVILIFLLLIVLIFALFMIHKKNISKDNNTLTSDPDRATLEFAKLNADMIIKEEFPGGEVISYREYYVCYDLAKVYIFTVNHYFPLSDGSIEPSSEVTLEGEYETTKELLDKLKECINQEIENYSEEKSHNLWKIEVEINDEIHYINSGSLYKYNLIIEEIKNDKAIWYSLDDETLLMGGNLSELLQYIQDNNIEDYSIEKNEPSQKTINSTKKIIIASPIVLNSQHDFRFSRFKNLTTIENIGNLDTSNLTDMSGMFSYCFNLKSIDISALDTSNVTTMKRMFYICRSLEEVNISNIDVSKVRDMSEMFDGCENLKNIDLSKLNVSQLENMSAMFRSCTSLTHVDLFKLNPNISVDTSSLFLYCDNLKEIPTINN